MKIYIDPGHGGSSIGATYKGRKEQDDCLKLALAVRDNLLTQKNVEVKMSRTTDVNPSISKRCSEANTWGADYFLSIHRNANSPNTGTGIEAWIWSKCKEGDKTFKSAEKVVKSVCSATGYKNRGVRFGAVSYADYGVNSMTKMSSCLLETGFIDNDNDNAIFDGKFDEMAKSIAIAIYEDQGGRWVHPFIEGDIDGDGKVTASDARIALRASVGSEKLNAEQMKASDVDGDGKVTASDARDILKMATSTSEAVKKEIKVGSTVRLKKGAKTFNGGSLASFVYERNHKVKEINVDRVVITYEGTVVAAVRKSDLILID